MFLAAPRREELATSGRRRRSWQDSTPRSDGQLPRQAQAVLALQRSAGNRAVVATLGAPIPAHHTRVQRCGDIPPDECPCQDGGDHDHDVASGSTPRVHRDADDTASCDMPTPRHLGTRRDPKLVDPGIPSGSKCRGACGPDCPDTCQQVGTYTERVEAGGCSLTIEFPNALRCGVHSACIEHDRCYDWAHDQASPWLARRACDELVRREHGVEHGVSWARGRGPYDRWWYFSDPPQLVDAQPYGGLDLPANESTG